MEALLSQSCLECHDDLTEKAGLSLEHLSSTVDSTNAETWQKCLELIERGFMPPADADQPSAQVRSSAILDLENRLVAFHQAEPAEDTHSVLRRLNRTEYRNTIQDLLKIELGSDPTSNFPGDQRSHGFSSNGEKLVTSSFLLRQYLEAAEQIVARAVHFEPRPEVQKWHMKPPFDRTTRAEQGQAANYYRKTGQPQPYQDLCQRIGAGGAPYKMYHPLDDISDDGVPVSGWYTVRIQAEAKFRHALQYRHFTRFEPKWDGSEPIRLALFTATLQGIDPENTEARDFAATHEQSDQRQVAIWDLPDDEKIWIETRVWLEQGQFLRLGFPNGPTNSNYRLNTYFKDLAAATYDEAELAEFENRQKKYGGWISFHFGESPRIRIYRVELQGPINETWPPASHEQIFGTEPYTSNKAENTLQRFANRAWRRPAAADEIVPFLQLVRNSESSGMTAEEAIQEGLKAILCSPEFLYREERNHNLNDHELANRLSYLLCASLPDATLRSLADANQVKPRLRQEALRLLSSTKSDYFVTEFLDGWLELNKLGSMAPDSQKFRVYYDERLEPAMRRETFLYFRHLLDSNGPIRNFLDSDYTFANENLATFYQIEPETFQGYRNDQVAHLDPAYLRQDGTGNSPTTAFARVKFNDRRRGGLLGQGAVLTLTANGVDTSPVIRGVWLMENILGTPPPPPPPGIPAIEPDIRGATTIRDQLQKHREAAACKSCHTHIDPPGFALESFDAIGKWRGHYKQGDKYPEIDSSGRFGSHRFDDIAGFKRLLLKREDLFARCLVEKLLMHALGRDLEIIDRPAIRAILDATKADGYRLRDLVLAVIESELFARK